MIFCLVAFVRLEVTFYDPCRPLDDDQMDGG